MELYLETSKPIHNYFLEDTFEISEYDGGYVITILEDESLDCLLIPCCIFSVKCNGENVDLEELLSNLLLTSGDTIVDDIEHVNNSLYNTAEKIESIYNTDKRVSYSRRMSLTDKESDNNRNSLMFTNDDGYANYCNIIIDINPNFVAKHLERFPNMGEISDRLIEGVIERSKQFEKKHKKKKSNYSYVAFKVFANLNNKERIEKYPLLSKYTALSYAQIPEQFINSKYLWNDCKMKMPQMYRLVSAVPHFNKGILSYIHKHNYKFPDFFPDYLPYDMLHYYNSL